MPARNDELHILGIETSCDETGAAVVTRTSDGRGIINANLAYFREIERRCRTVLTQHLPTEADLQQAATLIDYSLDEVVAEASHMIEIPDPLDRSFYGWAHDANIRYIMQWLMS